MNDRNLTGNRNPNGDLMTEAEMMEIMPREAEVTPDQKLFQDLAKAQNHQEVLQALVSNSKEAIDIIEGDYAFEELPDSVKEVLIKLKDVSILKADKELDEETYSAVGDSATDGMLSK